jgi:hypothetical protein
MASKTTSNVTVNYDDKRFTEVNNDKQQALTDLENVYGGMAEEADKYYQAQIDASKQWAETQSALQNQQTELAINEINQQKEQTTKDYTREQSGSYVDWQKQSNAYGVNAEQQAAAGMQNTGYSESSQVSMYNTYQNRVATARESYNIAIQNYNNSIAQARLQNSIALAEISYQALQTQLELSLEGFQYKNQLVLEKANKKTEIDNTYYNRYQDVLNQINTENAMAEQIRQYNEQQALEQKKYAEDVRQYNASLKEQQRQYNQTYALQQKQFEEEKRQFNESLKASKASSSGGGSSRSYSSGGSSGGNKSSGGNNTPKIKKDNTPKSSTKTIKTSYYSGSINPDVARYGAFANTKDNNGVAYQPKGISGHGTLSKSKVKKNGKQEVETITFTTTTKNGSKKTVTQAIWKAADGTKWYWEGRKNQYLRVPN